MATHFALSGKYPVGELSTTLVPNLTVSQSAPPESSVQAEGLPGCGTNRFSQIRQEVACNAATSLSLPFS
jgi:hypothetical protein